MLVSTWAFSPILGHLLGKRSAVDSLVQVTEFGGLSSPNLAVTSCLATQCMRDFVQKHLFHHLHISRFNQVPRDGDSLLRVVTKARSADGSVETK